MTPGPPFRLTCPCCGGLKHIMSIASGNTFGATIWSDTKRDYPMLPQPSFVQLCSHCGHYFFYDDSKPINAPSPAEEPRIIKPKWKLPHNFFGEAEMIDNGRIDEEKEIDEWDSIRKETHKNGFGDLTYEQADAAFDELFSDSLPDDRQEQLLFLWLFKYNDKYGGRDADSDAVSSEVVKKKRSQVITALISRNEGNTLFLAELYRELGEFEKSMELSKSVIDTGADGSVVAKQFVQHAEMKDSKVFPLVFEENED